MSADGILKVWANIRTRPGSENFKTFEALARAYDTPIIWDISYTINDGPIQYGPSTESNTVDSYDKFADALEEMLDVFRTIPEFDDTDEERIRYFLNYLPGAVINQ